MLIGSLLPKYIQDPVPEHAQNFLHEHASQPHQH